MFFPVKFAKVLRTLCFIEHLQWLLLTVSGFQPGTLLKKRLRQRCFSVNFGKYLGTSFERTPPNDCFFCLSVNLKSFQNTSFIEHLWETISCTSCRISTTRYSKNHSHKKRKDSLETRAAFSRIFIMWPERLCINFFSNQQS